MAELTDQPKQTEGLTAEEMPDKDTMILSANREAVYILNPMGAVVWELCDGNTTVEAMISLITETLPNTNSELITKDVTSLLDELSTANLITAA